MQIDRSVLPMHDDARATITEKDLLGERYIALDRGTAARPTLSEQNLRLGVRRTDRTVDLQDILNSVDDPTGTALGALVTALGEGSRRSPTGFVRWR